MANTRKRAASPVQKFFQTLPQHPGRLAAVVSPFLVVFVVVIFVAASGNQQPQEEIISTAVLPEEIENYSFSVSSDTSMKFIDLSEQNELRVDSGVAASQMLSYFQNMEAEDIPMILGEDNVDGKLLQPSLTGLVAAASLRNDETIGWFRIRNTNMNFAVVQDTVDVDFYTNRGYDKVRAAYTSASDNEAYNIYNATYGCVWAAPGCVFTSRDALSFNTTLFGHNWSNIYAGPRTDGATDIMFEQLAGYYYTSYAQEHPYINFSIANEDLTWAVVAAYYTEDYWPQYYTDIDFNYIDPNLDDSQRERFIAEILERSEYTSNLELSVDDNFLTLSTCTRAKGSTDRQRFVVTAVLIDRGQELPEMVYTDNPSPKAPRL